MRILLVTDSPFINGAYAQQGMALAQRLNAAGHTTIIFAPSYEGRPIEVDGVLLVGGIGGYSYEWMDAHAQKMRANIILTLKDPSVFDPTFMQGLSLPWVAIVPVDTEPLSTATYNSSNYASAVIAITCTGVEAFRAQGVQAHYAPLGIDTAAFSPGSKDEARKRLNLPDGFMALTVGNNNGKRKNLDQIVYAWDAFIRQHDDAFLFLHTGMAPVHGGLNLDLMTKQLGWNAQQFRISDQLEYMTHFLNTDFMATLYRAADVLICAGNEGFCLPAIEAQACGCPVIGVDFAALRETVKIGWKIPTQGTQYGERIWCSFGADWFRPSQLAIATYLEAAYQERDNPERAAKARQAVLEYDMDNVFSQYWLPVIGQLEALFVRGQLS